MILILNPGKFKQAKYSLNTLEIHENKTPNKDEEGRETQANKSAHAIISSLLFSHLICLCLIQIQIFMHVKKQ